MAKILEQELLVFLRQHDYNAAPFAPAFPDEIKEDYVTVEMMSRSIDIRTRTAESVLRIDYFIKNPEITGKDRFDAERGLMQILELIPKFVYQNLFVRRFLGAETFNNSDERFTYASADVTFLHLG